MPAWIQLLWNKNTIVLTYNYLKWNFIARKRV